jgi:hypothetical protein
MREKVATAVETIRKTAVRRLQASYPQAAKFAIAPSSRAGARVGGARSPDSP